MITGAKYNMLYPPLVQRILNEEMNKGGKDATKATKTRLHQMFGAYVQGNAHKKAAALLHEFEAGDNSADIKKDEETSRAIMALHASTKERLPHLEDFLAFIARHVERVETILDLGCGFNPFSAPFWSECFIGIKREKRRTQEDFARVSGMYPEATEDIDITYYAYDIDVRTRDLLNRFFAYLNLPQTASCADLVVETPAEKADLALMCKLVPVLEAQLPGRGFELARQTNAKFLVITYPLKSLGGREKGMGKNYAIQFEKARADGLLGEYKLVASEEIGSELVYLLRL